MQFETSRRDWIRTGSILASLVPVLGIADAAATDPGRHVAPDCIGAVADTAVSLAREAGGPSAFGALPENGRDVALRLFLAQGAVAGLAELYQPGLDDAGSAPRAACPQEVAVAITTSCGSVDRCWTLERISSERHAASGWGQVFHNMFQAGLLDMEKMLSVWNSNETPADAVTTSSGVTSVR